MHAYIWLLPLLLYGVSPSYMNAGSDSCGHPFCDQMVLEASGGVYWAEDIVIASKQAPPLIDSSCSSGSRSGSNTVFKRGAKRGAGGKPDTVQRPSGRPSERPAENPKAQISHSRGGSSEATLHSGDALIYFGPMSINSRLYDVPNTQGAHTVR